MGWAHLGGGKPISELIREEQIDARADMLKSKSAERALVEEARRKAREHAVDAMKQEGLMVSVGRGLATQSIAAAAEMLRSAQKLGVRVREKLDQMLIEDTAALTNPALQCPHCKRPSTMHIGSIVKLLDDMQRVTRNVVQNAHQVMVMERLHLGRPTEIIGVEDTTAPATLGEAAQRTAAVARALESAARRGLLAEAAPANGHSDKDQN